MFRKFFFRRKRKRVRRVISAALVQKLYPEKILLKGTRRHYLAHRERARECIVERLQFYKKEYALTFGRVSIRNQKSRWGSCSKKGNLNFNYRLFFLPPELRDYVIVHELAHIREHNHSPKFWREVERILPEYKKYKKAMRDFIIL